MDSPPVSIQVVCVLSLFQAESPETKLEKITRSVVWNTQARHAKSVPSIIECIHAVPGNAIPEEQRLELLFNALLAFFVLSGT